MGFLWYVHCGKLIHVMNFENSRTYSMVEFLGELGQQIFLLYVIVHIFFQRV